MASERDERNPGPGPRPAPLSREVVTTRPGRRGRWVTLAALAGLVVGFASGRALDPGPGRCERPVPARILQVHPEPASLPPRLLLLGSPPPAPTGPDEPDAEAANSLAGPPCTGNRVGNPSC